MDSYPSNQTDMLGRVIMTSRRNRYIVASAKLREATSYLLPWRCDDFGPWQPSTLDAEGSALMRRLHALREVDLSPSWLAAFRALEIEIDNIAARPRRAIAGRKAKAAERATAIEALSAAYDQLRPPSKRPDWICAQLRARLASLSVLPRSTACWRRRAG